MKSNNTNFNNQRNPNREANQKGGLKKKVGDALERLGDKVERAGFKKTGDAIEKLGDKVEHAGDKRNRH